MSLGPPSRVGQTAVPSHSSMAKGRSGYSRSICRRSGAVAESFITLPIYAGKVVVRMGRLGHRYDLARPLTESLEQLFHQILALHHEMPELVLLRPRHLSP